MDRTSGKRGLTTTSGAGGTEPLVSHSRRLGDASVGSIVDDADTARVQWATPDGLEIVGRGVAARLTAAGSDRFERVRERAREAFDGLEHDGPSVARPRAFGGFAFHDGHEPRPPWSGFEAASFVVPRVLLVRPPDAGEQWLTVVATDHGAAEELLEEWTARLTAGPAMRPTGSTPGVAATRRSTSCEEWAEQVETALEEIAAGRLTKVVLAQALTVTLEDPIAVPTTLERLRREYPNCYRFLLGADDGATFFGAPPERLVSKRGTNVDTEALAGSVPRGDTREADQRYVERMLEDEKFRHEHALVVEAIRDQLEPVASELTVDDRTVRRLATIQHLQTPISATLEADRHVLELVEALHPTPAVGGVPPDVAWETIRETESFERGLYAGPIGWFDAAGDGEFAVGLRSGVAHDGTVTLFAGNGIVADSDPDEEWDEVQLKFRPILDELE
ncbi:isochorismate synthase [Halopiger goleimassiliensis]|uniref:isochorismate synthase n=1 Tax=Halopiger goleimassiliensis TaxID=1293048 RepID=UPI000678081B|nr:isochorismate synthase [Halopiger goleimassiliensis]